jgi:MFS family permease
MLALFRRRNFVLVWLAGLISETGDWLLITGLPIYVFAVTGSTLTTATVFIVEMVPVVLLSSVAGVLVDRWNHRRTMILVSLGQASLLCLLFAVHGGGSLWLVYVVAASHACLQQVYEPARGAAIPALVERDQVGAANGMVGASNNAGRLVGASLGGLALVGGELTTIVLGDIATFLVATVLITVTRFGNATEKVESGEPRPAPIIEAWKSGIKVITGKRAIRAVFVNAALGSLAQGVFVVLFIVFIERALHGDSAEIGLLRGIQAVGGLAGGILVGVLSKKLSSRRFVIIGSFGIGVLEMAIWNAQYVTLAEGLYIGLFVAIGVPSMFTTAGLFTLLQEEVPASHLGRVFGAFLSVYGGAQALGMLVAGVLGDFVDVTLLLDFQAGLYLLSGVIAWIMLRRGPSSSGVEEEKTAEVPDEPTSATEPQTLVTP